MFTRYLTRSVVWLLLVFCGTPWVSAAQVVYECNFQRGKKAPPEWDYSETNDYGSRKRFLGTLTNQTVKLKLTKLPEHALVRVKFDLLIIHGWDGAATNLDDAGNPRGPDMFQLAVSKGPVLIRSSFCNQPLNTRYQRGDLQSYPELDPRILVTPRTGVAQARIPAYEIDSEDDNQGAALYQLSPLFTHQGGDLTLEFSAENLQETDSEGWGIDNVVVEVLTADEVAPLDAKRLTEITKVLGDSEPLRAATACWDLVARPEQAIALAKSESAKLLVEDQAWLERKKLVSKLLKELESTIFSEREQAYQALLELGASTQPIVINELEKTRSPEVRERLRRLATQWSSYEQRFTVQALMRMRLTRVLEIVNTPESLALAKQLDWE